MRFVEIKGKDVFKFKTVVPSYAKDDGKEHLFCNYVKEDHAIKLVLEAHTDKERMIAHERLTYHQFCRLYPKHRIYVQGYVERD